MASCQAKPTKKRKVKKKKAKKFKNIVMASFQAKTGWERPSQREKRNYRSDKFLPDLEQKIKKKIAKKFKKLKNIIMASFHTKMGWGRLRKREKKNVPISSYPTRNREFQKNSKKIQKI